MNILVKLEFDDQTMCAAAVGYFETNAGSIVVFDPYPDIETDEDKEKWREKRQNMAICILASAGEGEDTIHSYAVQYIGNSLVVSSEALD